MNFETVRGSESGTPSITVSQREIKPVSGGGRKMSNDSV
jgi:hypothetical protein